VAKTTFANLSKESEGAKWLRGTLKGGASLIAVGCLLASGTAFAQDDEAEEATDEDVIVVTGIRGALESAAQIKRNADTFVDSITASDISTLPDLSVAEALGRIPGLTVSRFPTGGGASPDFPSPEGRGNLIRGLGFVRSEFNGRDAFTANAGRALDWSSIPPELVGAVDVWKNQSADLIEGGIGGTINLRTLEPFDRPGLVIASTLDMTYSDLRKEWSPSGSITMGNRWDVVGGEFGLMGSYSRSLLDSRIHGWQQSAVNPRVLDANGNIPELTNVADDNRLNEFFGAPVNGVRSSTLTVDPADIVGTTTGFQMRTNDVDRDRESWYAAAQWKNDNLQLTWKYVRVDTEIDSVERTFEWWPEHNPGATMGVTDMVINPDFSSAGVPMCSGPGGRPVQPGDCETLIPIQGGLMESGFVTNQVDGWTGAYGAPIGSLGIGKQEDTRTQDWSFNAKWNATDRLYVEFDAHYTKSKARFMELWGGLNTWSNWWIKQDLDQPQIEFTMDPRFTARSAPDANGCQTGGFVGWATRAPGDDCNTIAAPTSLADPNGANFQFAADRWQVGTGDLYALRGDIKYDLDGGDGAASWFKAVRFGARYAERSQTNAEMGLNWGAIAPAWAGGYGIVGTFQNPNTLVEAVDFSDFFRGGTVLGDNSSFLFVNDELLTDYSAFRQYLLSEPQIGTNHNWVPRGSDDGTAFGSPNFLPQDTSDITEKTKNAYIRFDYGQDFDNGMSLDGNFGLRYVRTDVASTGFQAFRPWNPDTVQPVFNAEGVRVRTDEAESRDDPRDFHPEAALWTEQAAIPIAVDLKDTRWLPSFNAKLNLNDDMLIRFAVSKGLSRPNIQDLRASQEYVLTTNRSSFPELPIGDPERGLDRGAQDISLGDIRVNRGNPYLKPTTAWNYDLSYEYYFTGGYVSLAGFYKDIKNVISTGDMLLGTTTIEGQTLNIIYNGQVNQASAKVKGVEIAYQQFYDFLPGLLSNLGVQANYTYIDASAQPPSNGVDSDGDGIPDDVTQTFRWGVDDMLGQSKHIANAVGIYQDDNLEFRLAYNWRSSNLATYRDWVTGHPVYISAAGFLDASIKYRVNEHVQFRASIANILDTKSKAKVQIDQAGQMYDRFSFLNDRRIVVGVFLEY
jgi:iron complex outermembrane receptor protein